MVAKHKRGLMHEPAFLDQIDVASADGWSVDDTRDLEVLLLREDGLSISEMAALLKRDYRDVRDKVAEIARRCRSPRKLGRE
jgi:hypothetical protein